MGNNLLEFVMQQLTVAKGRWPSVATESGVDYCTIVRLGNGKAKDPAYKTIQKLADYFVRKAA